MFIEIVLANFRTTPAGVECLFMAPFAINI